MMVLSLMRWLVLAASLASPSATTIVFDVPDGPLRTQALAGADAIIAALGEQGDLIAIVDIRDGLAVARDFTTAANARDGVQRLRERSTWTYRHVAVSARAAGPARTAHVTSSLRSLAVDVARTGVRGRIVFLTDIASVDGGPRAHADTARAARALGVPVHVVAYRQGVETENDSLLGSTVTSTSQAMQDCDPRRVACGLTEQVGQEARRERAAEVATAARALARLADDTGGVFARHPQELLTLLGRASAPPGSTPTTRVTPDAPAWRVRDLDAAARLDRARLEYMHEPRALDVIRVPSAQGVRLVVVLHPTAVASRVPWYALLRIRDERGLDQATFSEARDVPATDDAPVIRELRVGPGQHVVHALVDAADGTHVERQVVDTADRTLAVGDLFLVDRVEVETPSHAGHPLVSDGRMHVPLASSLVRRSNANSVAAAIALPATAEAALLTVDLHSADQRTRRTTLAVPGRTDVHVQVIALPLSSLADGVHELRVSGEHEGRPWARARHFTIAP